MKKSIIFIGLFAAFAISFALLLRMGASLNTWHFWVVLLLLPAVGWIAAKTNFNTPD